MQLSPLKDIDHVDVVDDKKPHNTHDIYENLQRSSILASNALCSDNHVIINMNKKGIKVCHLNIQSFTSCFKEFKSWFEKNSFHVITLSETWLDETIHDSEIHLTGYVIERKDRNQNGGGVAI